MIGKLLTFVPLPWKLGAVALLAASFIGGAYYIYSSIEEAGYDRAIEEVAKTNGVARVKLRDAISKSQTCRDFGGRWDQSRGVCRNQHD